VFGKVAEGMNVVEEIEHVPTAEKGSLQNVPTTTIIIKQAKIKTFEENPKNKNNTQHVRPANFWFTSCPH